MTAGQFVEPVSHEGDVHLIFTDAGLDPYYALNRVVRKEYDEWDDGKPTARMNHRGETFRLAVGYDSQPLLPWDDSSYNMETTPLFRISLASCDRLSDGEPADQSSRTVGGTITIRPRWPGMKKDDGEPVKGIPNLNAGDGYIDCQIQVSNIPHDSYADLLRSALAAFDVSPGYVIEPHEASNVNDLARYVRVQRSKSSSIHAADGPIARTHAVLQAGQSGYRKHVEDHTELPGYYVTTTVTDQRAADIIPGHSLGKEIKHYYPSDPSYYEPGDALYHPKLEVSYQASQTDETLYWDDLDDAVRELDTTLWNYLEWAGLSLRADKSVFKSDAVFSVSESHQSAKIVDCPLPRIKDEQKHAVMSLWGDTIKSDRDLIDSLVSDGGRPSRDELADRTGYSYRTVRRFVNRCEEVVNDAYDGLSIESKHQEQMLINRVRTAETQFRESVETAVTTAADAAAGRARSKWGEIKQKWGISEGEKNYKKLIKVRYKPADREEMDSVIQNIKVAARSWFDSLRRVTLEITTQNGEHRSITNLESWTPASPKSLFRENMPKPEWYEPADEIARDRYDKKIESLQHHRRRRIVETLTTD